MTERETLKADVPASGLVQQRPTNVLVVGVGGQGVIMVSKVLASLSKELGHQVKQSEVHGMAKRGGAVFSHVRFGPAVFSSTIPEGEADILVALEWAEGLRWLPHLKQDSGTFIADTQHIVPPFACRNRSRGANLGYPRETVPDVMEKIANSFALDAVGIATELGVAKAANTVLLGTLSAALDFPVAAWKSVISEFVPPKTIEANIRAFDAGREWALSFDRESQLKDWAERTVRSPAEVVDSAAGITSTLEITEEWCKGCDICIKFCPERCLAMDARQIAVLVDPDRCTGCRICEWLCPDLAITVHTKTNIDSA